MKTIGDQRDCDPTLFRIGRTRVAAISLRFLFEQTKRYAGGGRRYAAVDRRGHGDQCVQFIVGQAKFAGFFDPVPGTGLTAAGQRHGQPDQVFLPFVEQVGRMRLLKMVFYQRIVVRHFHFQVNDSISQVIAFCLKGRVFLAIQQRSDG